ncbi:MAG: hypothetical protein KUG56_04990 [Kordiimonadaceae bacterium]|nr:hypothetical protein [Kordiimonadaceae bacterium]
MNALRLIAGKTARKRIEDNGLTPDLVRLVLGASGGPKWLTLCGLDKFIFGEWLHNSTHKIDLVGSSIGAWRMTNAAHPDAGAMIDAFLELYFQMRKEHAKNAKTFTQASYNFLEELYGPNDILRILGNTKRNLNIVTVRAKNLTKGRTAFREGAEILASVGANAIDRSYLAKFYERVVFHSGEGVPCPLAWQGFGRQDVLLRSDTLADVLMASGSIPFVVDPIIDIGGAPAGIYRDGGMIDYHFDVPWRLDSGIVLYPHFYSYIVPGWFDKNKKKRLAKGETWDQMLMLAPSDAFVAGLPGGKIPDRQDFARMSDEDRLKYWTIVTRESEKLAEEFSMCLTRPELLMERLEKAPE